MVPGEVIDSFDNGMLVMHPSLLPKFRGACPIQHAILQGETKTGVSVIEISKNKFDAGDILWQKEMPMSKDTKFDELQASLSGLGGIGLFKVLNDFENFKSKAVS